MTRAESKARNSFEKTEKAYRKHISKKYGWKQSDYINWKIISEYYFCLYHLSLEDAYLEVKPLFVDDLWWDIFEMSENKQAPKSLRGLGAFAVSGVKLKDYCVFDSKRISDYSEDEIERIWDDLFREIEQNVADFLKENPDPESFSPSDEQKYGRLNPIYTLMMDIYSGNADKALERINSYKSCGKGSGYSGPKGDAFDYIAEWCKKRTKSNTFEHLIKWCKNKSK